ncbi:MAG: YdeI/OmpD-associated family protein [Candidatus Sulfotelmatobacter sp.]
MRPTLVAIWRKPRSSDRFSFILGNEVAKDVSALRFQALVQIRGINPFVTVSASHAAKLKPNWRKPLPVLVRINRKPVKAIRTNMMPAGDGIFYLYLNGAMRKEAAASVGDVVQVEIEFDTGYRNGPLHSMPRWFGQALKGNPKVEKNWNALAPSRKKEILRYFAQLKSSGARTRNVARALQALSGATARFMARTWTNGS